MDRLRQMSRFFDSTEHLARFLGVTAETVRLWRAGKRFPTSVTLRLMDVLETLEMHASEIHSVLVETARPPAKVTPLRAKRLRYRKTSVYSDPSIPSPVVKRAGVWDDSYWYDRSLTRAEMDAGEYPLIEDWSDATAHMSDATYARYNDTCNAYLRRTGRVMPD